MRKIICLVLCVSMALLFTACGNNEDETTSANAFEYYSPDSTTIETETEQVDGTNIYILTTDESFEVPTIVTTTFDVGSIEVITSTIDTTATTTTSVAVVITTASTTVPVVATSSVTTSSTTTTADETLGQAEDDDETTTVTSDETTTTSVTTATEKTLIISSLSYDASSGKIYAQVDKTGWNSSFAGNSTSITITDNDSIIGYATCSITAGSSMITIDVSSLDISDDPMLKFTIPANFITTTDGSQYSTIYVPSGYLSN